MFTSIVRALGRLVVRLLFRVRVNGLEHHAAAGTRVLIVANHVSWLDGALLWLMLPRAPACAIDAGHAMRWYLRPFLALAERHPVDLLNPVSLKSLVRVLTDDRHLLIFPEGRVTTTGSLMKVYDGPGFVADRADATILPVGIDGLEFSRCNGLKGLLRQRLLPPVRINILPPRRLALAAGLSGAPRRAAAATQLAGIMREVAFANASHDATLFDALVRAATTHGRATLALEDATGARLTYGAMVMRSFVLGAVIAGLTRRGERVGIMLPSTAAAVVTLFACQARGREAAMLNFTAGAAGLVTAIETASIGVVFTSRAFIDNGGLEAEAEALAANSKLVYLEDLRERIGIGAKLGGLLASRMPTLAHRLLRGGRGAADPAVILFTSGSEGIPKGVVLSHANLLSNFAQVSMLIDLTRRDRVLNVLPVFHAFGLLGGVLLPLLKGTPSYQYPNPLHYRLVPELCYELGVSCLFGTTTFLRGYARHAHPYDLHRMRFVISGAEKMTEEVERLWADKFGLRIFEGYGATEASPVLSVNNPLAAKRGTVGQLLAGMDYYLEPVEGISEGGELVVSGPNVMLGYLFHGSDGRIIPPWTEARGAGWYATGDIVTLDDDRFITIQGRAKRFAKIGGEMVSLAAVEDLAVRLAPDGQHAAVAVGDSRKGEQIILVSDTPDVTRAELVACAREVSASELTIPRRVVHVDEVPLLGSGKTDYHALSERIEELT